VKVRLLPCLLVLFSLAACSGFGNRPERDNPSPGGPTEADDPPLPAPSQAEITVAAAADLQFAFSDIAALFEEQTGHSVTLVFGSTGQLAQQIENGAPYDLFAAANIEFVQQLLEKDLVLEDSVSLYARGRIVLAANRQSGVTLAGLEDLLDPQIRHVAIANPEHAPYGVAARQALESAGLWEALQPKIVYGENVRQALQYVQTGDVQAGIVALSVADVPEITWTLLDDSLHQPLDQALAVVTSSPRPEVASEFASFINGEQGRPVMRLYGFILPGETPVLRPEQAP
jgi:molybdate transport system substrate-binding protein